MKSKSLFIVAIFFVTSITSAYAQYGVSISNSFTMENTKLFSLKDKNGQTLNLFYYYPEGQGLSLQLRNNELWKYGSGPTNFVQLKSVGIQAFLYECIETESKFFWTHQVGILVAVGNPVHKESEDLHLLKCALFSGVFIEIGTGIRLSEKTVLIFSIKSEGIYGAIRDGSDGGQAGSANGFVSLNLRLKFNQQIKEQYVENVLDPI
ncbi:MAG: hypothetical protein WAV23_02395 [Minisyncoccia bacterium]